MALHTASDAGIVRGDRPTAPPAVLLEDVSVRYRVPQDRAGTLKEHVLHRLRGRTRFVEHDALRAVTVGIAAGDALAVIGANGSGKTTLLRLIARVLRPTTGRVRVRGRVAPILDLVGGFHPELTGRENVLLNGTLLGLGRREIGARLAHIIEFAEIDGFIDAPLRTYSAGMVLRLGFAVATDAEPDVLVIDEALGVGDERFQRKCAARLDGFRTQGITFVLVSHDMHSVRRLCTRALWLDRGRVRMLGPADDVVAAYLAAAAHES